MLSQIEENIIEVKPQAASNRLKEKPYKVAVLTEMVEIPKFG